MDIVFKPWFGKESGRILVVKHQTVILSKHYRNSSHRTLIVNDIKEVINESNIDRKCLFLLR